MGFFVQQKEMNYLIIRASPGFVALFVTIIVCIKQYQILVVNLTIF